MEKYCPLQLNNETPQLRYLCSKEECAWWTQDEYNMCAIVRIAKEIQSLIPSNRSK